MCTVKRFSKIRLLRAYVRVTGSPWFFALIFFAFMLLVPVTCRAQENQGHLMLSAGLLYERGLDATLAYERTRRYHHAWEFFATGYVKYGDDPLAGHITKKSLWHNYSSWHLGIAYKPCVSRGRNHHGNLRLGGSGGSDLDRFVGGVHVGYEHSYALRGGWEFFFQVREDIIIKGDDLFRTGVSLGLKVPLGD